MSNFNSQKRSLHLQTLQHGLVSLPLLVVLFSLLSAQLPAAAAQQQSPPPDNQYPYARFSPSMAIIIVVLIAALFFMGFFSIYIRHCNDGSSTGNSIRQTLSMRRRTAASRGLDASVLETFPTFTYAEVKDHKIGKGALECAVCLNEFEDDETLRLIPKCDHVFHPECIDAWLESHVTCPVCRANLVPGPAEEQLPEVPVAVANETTAQEEANNQPNEPRIDEVSILVDGDESQQQRGGEEAEQRAKPEVVNRSGSLNRPLRSLSVKIPRMFGKFRSHSTGHSLAANSLVVPGENLDRFTLRLPDQVRKEVMTRALLNRTGSYAGRLPREGSTRRGYRTGDGSSRGGRSYRRIDPLDRAARSDRWTFLNAPQLFSRALSIKSPKVTDNGEGSTSSKSPRPTVRMPSFKCLEPKSADETSLVRSDSARPPV